MPRHPRRMRPCRSSGTTRQTDRGSALRVEARERGRERNAGCQVSWLEFRRRYHETVRRTKRRANTPAMLAIRPLNGDEVIAITPPGPTLAIGPVVDNEPTPAIRPAEPLYLAQSPASIAPTPAATEPTPAVVMPGPVVSGPTPTVATPGPVGPEPTPAVRVPVPAVVTPGPVATPSEPTPAVAPPTPVALPVAADDGERVQVVYHLRSVPASIIANSLRAIFPKMNRGYAPPQLDEVIIEPEPTSNSLLISGPKAKVEEAQRLAKELDQPAAMVRLEVRISEVDSAKVKKADETAPRKTRRPTRARRAICSWPRRRKRERRWCGRP